MRLKPGDEANILNLEIVRLVFTNQNVAISARESLNHNITNAALRPVAMQHLLADAISHHDLPRSLAYSKEIASSPSTGFPDKIPSPLAARRQKR